MSKITRFNKLVRDRIPHIIQASGKYCTVEVLDGQAYLDALDANCRRNWTSISRATPWKSWPICWK